MRESVTSVPGATRKGPASSTPVGWLELGLNALVILIVPLVMRPLGPRLLPIMEPLGFGGIVERLSGRGGWTDIGWDVVSTRGWAEPGFSAYDTLRTLDHFFGMGWLVDEAQNHPPFARPLGLPLAYLDYNAWLPFWIVAMAVAIALSMRVMSVPAWVAYPVAVGLSMTFPGLFALTSNYPVSALALALAWVYRDRWVVAGTSYAILGATRGIGLIMLVYPFVRRQWKTLALAVGIVVGLSAVATAVEPGIWSAYLEAGRHAIEINMRRGDLITPTSILSGRGIPTAFVWVFAAAWVGFGIYRKRELFWLLAWFSFAVTPIAWYHSPIMGVPFGVVMWRSGTAGRILTLLTAAAFVSTTQYSSIGWMTLVVASGISVVLLATDTGATGRADA